MMTGLAVRMSYELGLQIVRDTCGRVKGLALICRISLNPPTRHPKNGGSICLRSGLFFSWTTP